MKRYFRIVSEIDEIFERVAKYRKTLNLVELLKIRPDLDSLQKRFVISFYLKDLDLDKIWEAYWPLAGPQGALKNLSKVENLSPKTFNYV